MKKFSSSASARLIAWEVLNKAEKSDLWVEKLLSQRLPAVKLPEAEQRLCRELSFGVLKARIFLDYMLQPFLKKQPPAKLMNLLRLGAYQLLKLDRIPSHAAVNETVNLAKPDFSGVQVKFINAVLREITRQGARPLPDKNLDPVTHLSIRYSLPLYLVERWQGRFGQALAESMMAAANETPPLVARVNRLRGTREEGEALLTRQGFSVKKGRAPAALCLGPDSGDPARLPGFQEGWFYFQDQAAQLVGYLADPAPTALCLDLCSAPGGKTTHLAELVEGQGRILAYDIQAEKLLKVEKNAKRLGLKNIEIIRELSPALEADRVLVDAPCSGTGTLRRHAEIRWRVTEKDFRRMAGIQEKLLNQAVKYVKPGGWLIYSTCSTEPEENEEVVNGFLAGHPEFELIAG
ncbi:16S rRNA (cytosine(967)-C(5))-methyltransferase RsmB, partial [bacterium]|nr:16S rRNA (cytosine(967)-C(5))-methyltransferase RsmB [bacterium]